MAVPKKRHPRRRAAADAPPNWVLGPAGPQRVPAVPARPRSPTWCARIAGGTRADRPSKSTSGPYRRGRRLRRFPVAVDAMGGDRAPGKIVAGARRAADELGIEVVLVGPPDAAGRHR